MSGRRHRVGEIGERLAAAFLERHGLEVIGRNVAVGGGEVDILAVDGRRRVLVEVRTITGDYDPLEAFDSVKSQRVSSLAREAGADRVDLVAMRLGPEAAEVRWIRGVG